MDMKDAALFWPQLIEGTLIRRYKRFLADVRLKDGSMVTAHCPNSGSMTTCSEPGRPVFISKSDNPKRKLSYTWELIDMGSSLVGVNTNVPNRLVKAACEARVIPELSDYGTVAAEVTVNAHTRLDLMLSDPDLGRCYVEIKNCTLVTDGQACFPDAVTLRGQKHLLELMTLAKSGARVGVFLAVQRGDGRCFGPADFIDPRFAELFWMAVDRGVEFWPHVVGASPEGIALGPRLPLVSRNHNVPG